MPGHRHTAFFAEVEDAVFLQIGAKRGQVVVGQVVFQHFLEVFGEQFDQQSVAADGLEELQEQRVVWGRGSGAGIEKDGAGIVIAESPNGQGGHLGGL